MPVENVMFGAQTRAEIERELVMSIAHWVHYMYDMGGAWNMNKFHVIVHK